MIRKKDADSVFIFYARTMEAQQCLTMMAVCVCVRVNACVCFQAAVQNSYKGELSQKHLHLEFLQPWDNSTERFQIFQERGPGSTWNQAQVDRLRQNVNEAIPFPCLRCKKRQIRIFSSWSCVFISLWLVSPFSNLLPLTPQPLMHPATYNMQIMVHQRVFSMSPSLNYSGSHDTALPCRNTSPL